VRERIAAPIRVATIGSPSRQAMPAGSDHPIVHLELQTGNLPRAHALYTRLFGWRAETVRFGRNSYLALRWGDALGGGVVEVETARSLWLPYVEVEDIIRTTDRAIALGAAVTLAPREGPAGWRSVLAAPDAAEIALWQPKL
jgi:predicted enzyme related to lactoylglutathione lyase